MTGFRLYSCLAHKTLGCHCWKSPQRWSPRTTSLHFRDGGWVPEKWHTQGPWASYEGWDSSPELLTCGLFFFNSYSLELNVQPTAQDEENTCLKLFSRSLEERWLHCCSSPHSCPIYFLEVSLCEPQLGYGASGLSPPSGQCSLTLTYSTLKSLPTHKSKGKTKAEMEKQIPRSTAH